MLENSESLNKCILVDLDLQWLLLFMYVLQNLNLKNKAL